MKAFKGFYIDESGQLSCRDMVYEPNKTYKYEGEIELCERGYHACETFEDMLSYYPYEKGKTVFYEVECKGDIIKSGDDSKFVCSEITLLKELHGWWEKYDCVGDFYDGFAKVEQNIKLNFIDTECKLVSNQWFDDVWYFVEGFAPVKMDGKWYFINTEGKFLTNKGFDGVLEFNEGVAAVRLNGKENFINTDGNLISNQWFDYVESFHSGFAIIRLNGKCNFINTDGNLVSDQWFDDAWYFYNGFAQVELNDTEYKLDKEGNLHEK